MPVLPQGLEKALQEREKDFQGAPLGRLFYLALPPSVYPQASLQLTRQFYRATVSAQQC